MHSRLFVLGVALVAGCGTPLVIQHMDQAAADQVQQQATERSADQLTLAHELPITPPDVPATFVDLLAEGGTAAAADGCLLFSDQAAAHFAAVNDAPTCVTAMLVLQHQVSDPSTYSAGLTVPDTAWVQLGDTATVNGCALSWTALFTDASVTPPGPAPGMLTLTRLDNYGWQIANYQPC